MYRSTNNHENIPPPSEEDVEKLVRKYDLVVFTCTYYPNVDDLRLGQCLATLRDPVYGASRVPIVVVDGSPKDVHEILASTTGAVVRREQRTFGTGKGGALREAAAVAASLPGVTDATLLCWQEPEKSDMNRCWVEEVRPRVPREEFSNDGEAIVCPARDDDHFRKSYPIEQYHSENYGNHYLNAVMRDAIAAESARTRESDEEESGGGTNTATYFPCGDLDWHFGPFAFRKSLLRLWTEYQGTSYDAQLIPIVAAIRKGYRVNTSVIVTFDLDERMKQQEEGNIEFIEKRLSQLNDLDPKIKRFWEENPLYC